MKCDSESWPHARARTTISSVTRLEVPRQLFRGAIDGEPGPQVRLLGGDAHRAVVGVARPHPDTADRLERGVGDRDRVGTEGERLDHVLGTPEAAGGDERDVAGAGEVEVPPGPRQGRHRRHADRVPKDRRRGAGRPAAAVEDDVVDAEVERRVEMSSSMCCADIFTPIGTPPDVPADGRRASGHRAASSSP